MEKIRKEIHLPPATVKELKKIADALGMSPKKYMEDLIINETKGRMDQIKKLSTE
jgi:hypothetical protein